ncbi:penicillin-binding transpeptidase domain-containing protein [Fusibacter sp. JL216-2]|uniref:penicillin-binding transpeptidase domain-containing protein n=1 Tax=Fusibacter sp. JL216-2 TaxID=3071453 RepID=UPI003D33AB59
MEILKKLKDRRIQIIIIFSMIFIIMVVRLAVLTITNGEYYREMSVNKRLKQIPVVAKRGEILDRNGVLLAGNLPSFTVNVSGSTLTSKEMNKVAVRLIDILNEYDQSHIEFPIRIDNGTFYFSYDKNIDDWLSSNGYEGYRDAEDLFDEIRRREQVSVVLTDTEAQKILKLKGVYLPFSQSKMKFYSEIDKERFLDTYGLDYDISAEEAFRIIRDRREFGIDEDVSDEDAYKILALKHDFKVLGYRKYVPITIAKDIDESVAVLISEMSMDLPGVTVEIDPKRFYPYKDTASHVLGYMGKIAQQDEIDKYVKKYKYDRNQLIGKVGIEGSYELDLTGQDGWKYIEVDALGKLVREVPENELTWLEKDKQPKKTISGEDIQLTIDIELQKKVEEYLEYGLKTIQEGGVYESKWGNYNYRESFPNAQTGSVVVVDVKTGEVLAMASYPDYDVNLFATGISAKDWAALQPDNPRNPLAPRPLYNLTALTAVQPGSAYKMVTGFAAMLEGLDPTKKLYADGFIEIGGHSFGCWYWNSYRGRHGLIDLYKAIEVSCNYYFFDIATGYDWSKDKPLDFKMNTDLLLEHSKKLGLDEPSGVEIYENNPGIPDPDKKKRQLENALRRKLNKVLADYFPVEYIDTDEETEDLIEEIVSWSDENPSRGAVINKLRELGIDTYEIAEGLADIIKYDYFNQMEWFEGDTLNLSIGQGAHQYTPLQIARFIATIANDGYLNELTLIRKVGDEVNDKNAGVTNEGVNEGKVVNDVLNHLRIGMLNATQEDAGTARIFKNFPITVAAKTGTAEKEGLIPPLDEVAYLKENMARFDPSLKVEDVEKMAEEILIMRNDEIADLEKRKRMIQDESEIERVETKINKLIRQGYLDYSSALRQAIKDMSHRGLDDEIINSFRDTYDNYAWFVSFGPYEDPEIAVVSMLPQGGHGGYASPIVRDVYAEYFGIEPESEETEEP